MVLVRIDCRMDFSSSPVMECSIKLLWSSASSICNPSLGFEDDSRNRTNFHPKSAGFFGIQCVLTIDSVPVRMQFPQSSQLHRTSDHPAVFLDGFDRVVSECFLSHESNQCALLKLRIRHLLQHQVIFESGDPERPPYGVRLDLRENRNAHGVSTRCLRHVQNT